MRVLLCLLVLFAGPVLAQTAPVGVGALGRVEPQSRVRKLTHPGGMSVTRVSRVLVAEGDVVRAGQVLAEFADAAQKDGATMQAEATLAQAVAALDKLKAGGRDSDIAAQRARIAALAAAEEIARRDAVRAESLVPGGAGPVATAERNRFAAMQAAAGRAEAEAVLQTLLTPRAEDVAMAEGVVLAARGALDKAREDAALSRLVAPIAGTILKIYAWPGMQVGNDGLLDMADLDHLDVVADVYETDVIRLRIGAGAEIVVPGDPARYAAVVREIGLVVRRSTEAGTDPVLATDARTVEVRLTLGETGRAALARRVGMQVQVAIKP